MLDRELLDGYLGFSMRDICPHGYDSEGDNHCAHFIAHVLQLGFGVTCASMRGRRGAPGAANLRVQEVFEQCPSTRELIECPSSGEGLIFVSDRRNFRGSPVQIRNVRKKHVGLMLDGKIWHYSNTRERVEQQTIAGFLTHYRRQQNALWWADFPRDARPAGFATSA